MRTQAPAMRDDRQDRRDDGMSLIEVVVASVLGLLIATMVGGFLISASEADRTVRSLNAATSAGQLVLDSLRQTLQSVADPMVVEAGAEAGDLVLRAKVAGTDPDVLRWDCVAWYFDASSGELRTERAVTDVVAATLIPTPDAAGLAGWTLLATGLSAPEAGDVFTVDGTGKVLNVGFRIDAEDSGLVAFSTAVRSRNEPAGVNACVP